MDYAQLGRTGVKVSRLCLGTMNFGPHTSEADSFAIMDRALELGINFFDTANVYGRQLGEGITEQIVGRWFAQGDGRRDKVVLATKVYGRMSEWPNDSRLSAYHIRRACEESLRRLQTDHIDLYQMHHIDRNTPWEEVWQAMETLVQQGKVVYVGSSNFAGWHLARAQELARTRHFLGLVSEQSLYNLMDRMIELEVIPACREYGLALLPWSPLAGGLLGGILEKEAAVTPKKAASKLEALRQKRNVPTGRVALLKRIEGDDLRTRVQTKLLSSLDQTLDLTDSDETRKVLAELYTAVLLEENIILARAERKRLFEQVMADLLTMQGRRASESVQTNLTKHRAQVEQYERLCHELEESPADIALAWLLNNPDVTAPIIGPRTLAQLEGSLRALKIKFSKDTLKRLDEIWPSPGGEAPEAYAW